MSNSNTEHSRRQRSETAAEWTKENTKQLPIRYLTNNQEDLDLIEQFKSIEADSHKARLKILIDHFLTLKRKS